MKKQIAIYNKKFDFTFLTKKEVDNIFLYDNGFIYKDNLVTKYETDKFIINQYSTDVFPEFELGVPNIYYLSTYGNSNKQILLNYIFENYYNTEHDIWIVTDFAAEDWLFTREEHYEDIILEKIKQSKNLKLIHHQPNLEGDNLFFNRKIFFQNFIENAPSLALFSYFAKYFSMYKKEKRIGFHINKFVDFIRKELISDLVKSNIPEHEKFYLTINKTDSINQISFIPKDKIEKFFIKNNLLTVHNEFFFKEWYMPGLFELSAKSDIEIVYETHSYLQKDKQNITEKTFKHLMLGKPFINADINSYNLVKKFGFKTYDILLSEDLKQIFNYKSNVRLNNHISDYKLWKDHLLISIQNLLNMNQSDYDNILNECKEISAYNTNLMDKILFEENIQYLFL